MEPYIELLPDTLARMSLGNKYIEGHEYKLIEDAMVFTVEDMNTGKQFILDEVKEFSEERVAPPVYSPVSRKDFWKVFFLDCFFFLFLAMLFFMVLASR